MKRSLIALSASEIPSAMHPLIDGARIYDSSCSPIARVYYIDKDCGYYLKRSPKGSLEREAAMTRYFHSKGLAAKVVEYFAEGEFDWMLTERVSGEDCTHREYLSDPKRLCDTLAVLLRELHEENGEGCPVSDRMKAYLSTLENNYAKGEYDLSYLSGRLSKMTAGEAYAYVEANRGAFKSDTLLHGDYCLPNVMLDNWSFSGFIDLDGAGVGDRHVDLFWGAWTLNFNLKTDEYRERFFDAYGRDRVDLDMIDLVSAAEVFG